MYRKLYLSKFLLYGFILLFLFSGALNAQRIEVTAGKGFVYPQYENRIDFLVMMYDITAASEISITLPAPGLTVNWFRYPDNQFVGNQNSISPDDHTGYLAKITGVVNGQAYNEEISVWVIDYKLYPPVFNALTVPDPQASFCDKLTLTVDGVIPEMYYQTKNGLKYKLDRKFKLHYETLEWNEEWKDLSVENQVDIREDKIEINDPPAKDTYFTLTGDEQFAKDLNVAQVVVQSPYYQSIRVVAKIKTEATVREEKHEGDRPDQVTAISGSAPLEINFSAMANVPVASYFRWEIASEGDPFVVRTGESHRYTFKDAGTYTVKLIAENAYCNCADSVVIKISESALYAPNVFTPNDDGFNDEFRVAYKSIVEFNCWIFNRWGSKVYHWSDPQKGWDGKVNGRPVNEGPYFYVIKSKGADGKVYNLKGDINLLRGKKK